MITYFGEGQNKIFFYIMGCKDLFISKIRLNFLNLIYFKLTVSASLKGAILGEFESDSHIAAG